MTAAQLGALMAIEQEQIASILGPCLPVVLDAAERSAALVTLCQGIQLNHGDINIDSLVDIALRSFTSPIAQGMNSDSIHRTIVDALTRLYRADERLRPIEPAAFSSYFVGRILGRSPELLALLLDAHNEVAFTVFVMLNRATGLNQARASADTYDDSIVAIEAALEAALLDRLARLASPLLAAANSDVGSLQDIAIRVLLKMSDANRIIAASAIMAAARPVVGVNFIPAHLRALLGNAAEAALGPSLIFNMDESSTTLVSQCRDLVDQSIFLLNAGRRTTALVASEHAVELANQLITRIGPSFLPDLASSLSNYGSMLSHVGQMEEALRATQRAVDIRKQLVKENPDLYLADLGISLNNLSIRLANVGRRADSLQAIEEAVEVRRKLTEHDPAKFLPSLAISLNNLSVQLTSLGYRDRALKASTETVNLYRQLVQTNRDAYLLDFAMAQDNLSRDLANFGLHEEALSATEESIASKRELVSKNPGAFLPDLATALNNLGIRRSNLRRFQDACAATEEAVQIYRELVAQNQEAFLSGLAMSLNNLSGDLLNLGAFDKSINAVEESIVIRWELAAKNRDAILPDLARAKGTQANVLLVSGRVQESVDAYGEAIQLLKPYFDATPLAFGDLWRALLFNYLRALRINDTSADKIKEILAAFGVQVDDIEP